MEVEVNIERGRLKPKIVIHTGEMTQEIQTLVRRLTDSCEQVVPGYKNEEVILLNIEEIYRFSTQGQKVIAQTKNTSAQIRFRLYELEEKLSGTQFIRISNSEIVNLKKVKSLDFSISGTITMKFDTGDKSFVSRRYVERIKEHIGIKK